MSSHTNLVIVRAGSHSLHRKWVLPASSERSWDLWVSSYEPGVLRDDAADFVSFEQGSKLTGVHALLQSNQHIFDRYNHVFLPDDDLEMTSDAITSLFTFAHEYRLALSQPSLSLESYVSREITLTNKTTLVRYTNWVESMAPCFSSSALRQCHGTFPLTLTGWGQEVLWCAALTSHRVGIVDAVQATHTRPFGGPNYAHAQQLGTNALCEMVAMFERHHLRQPLLRLSGVVTLERERSSQARLLTLMTASGLLLLGNGVLPYSIYCLMQNTAGRGVA